MGDGQRATRHTIYLCRFRARATLILCQLSHQRALMMNCGHCSGIAAAQIMCVARNEVIRNDSADLIRDVRARAERASVFLFCYSSGDSMMLITDTRQRHTMLSAVHQRTVDLIAKRQSSIIDEWLLSHSIVQLRRQK
jgi:hypothetical protein